MPDWPRLRNGRSGGSNLFFATSRRVLNVPNDSGIGWPARRIKSGFGSNRSTWLGPPDMKRKMTLRARGAKCGGFGASGLAGASGDARWLGREQAVALEQRSQREHAEAAAGAAQELAARRRAASQGRWVRSSGSWSQST